MPGTALARSGDVNAIEVMIGLVVVGVGMVPVLSTSVATGGQTGFTRAQALAQVHAATLCESTAARGFEELARAERAGEPLEPSCGVRGPFEVNAYQVRFHKISDAVGSLTVDVDWRLPGESTRRRSRAIKLVTKVDASWTISQPLPRPQDSASAD